MAIRKNPPMLMCSPFSNKIFVVTRYKVIKDHNDGTALFDVIGDNKYDVTENFEYVAKQYFAEKRRRLRAAARKAAKT